MDDISVGTLVTALFICLVVSAFFSMTETAMMAINRYKLSNMAQRGVRSAQRTTRLLKRTDQLLGVILLGNTLINTASATISTLIAARLFVDNELALGLATLLVGFAILVFSEATPKVIAANHPEPIALWASLPLSWLLRLFYPAVWFVNLFVDFLLSASRLKRQSHTSAALTAEELKIAVLESGPFMTQKHQSILLNLFDLERVTVDDIMTPRAEIEAINLDQDDEGIFRQLATSQHTRIPVYRGDPSNITGVVHIRKVLATRLEQNDPHRLDDIIRPAYFIPLGTPLFSQLQQFQENKRRLALVVDEYGELRGLITLEDILELIVGEFTTQGTRSMLAQEDNCHPVVEGQVTLRELNRKLGFQFDLDGPKTLNGLILEYFEAIPEPGTCMQIDGCKMEIIQTREKSIRSVRLYLPYEK